MPDIDPKNIEAVAKQLGISIKNAEELIKKIKSFHKESTKAFKDGTKLLSDINNELGDATGKVRDMDKEVRKLHLQDKLETDSAIKLQKELKDISKEIARISKMKGPLEKSQLDIQKKLVAGLNKQIDRTEKELEEARLSATSFGEAMEKSGPSFMKRMVSSQKGVSQEIGGWGSMFNKAGTNLSKMPGLLKLTGKAAKGLGGVLGGVSKMFAGWPGLIMMAVKKIWDIGMEADQFVKDANKAFARLRGPDITGDVEKQFKEFNDQIFKTSANLRTGMDVTQIRSLMEAMVQAGYNITQLNRGLLNYRDAIYVAAKASKTLGMELPQVGSIIGKMFTDLRMNLDEVDKAFIQVGFDAKKSGLSTDRFWNAVANASAHLALYGVVVSSASKTMKRFTEDMVGGADDAEEAVTDMYDVFKKGALEGQAAILDFAKRGGADINKMFEEMSERFKGKAIELKGKIQLLEAQDQTPEVVEELKKTRAEFFTAQSKSNRFLNMIGKNSVTQASEMGALAEEAPEILISAVKRIAEVGDLTEISGDRMLVAIKAAAEMGVSEKTVRMLVETARVTKERINYLADISGSYFSASNTAFKENQDAIVNAMEEIANTTGEVQTETANKLSTILTKSLGMDEDMAETLGTILKSDKKNRIELINILRKGDADSLKKLDNILRSSQATQALTIGRFKDQLKTEESMAESAEDTFKGIVGQTLSYKEMVEIAKDEIKWRASSLGVLQALNTGVMNIFGFLVRDNKEYMSESQKLAQQQIKASLAGTGKVETELRSLLKEDAKGNILQSSQIALTKKTTEEIHRLESLIDVQREVQRVLEEASRAKDPAAVFDKAIKESTGSLQTELKAQKEIIEKLDFSKIKLPGAKIDVRAFKEALAKTELTSEEQEETVKELDLINRSVLSGTKKEEKINKLRNDLIEKMITGNRREEELLKKEKAIQEDMQSKLKEMNKNNALVAKFNELMLKADPKAMKSLAEDFKSHLAPGATSRDIMELADSFGMDLKTIKEAYKEAGFKTGVIEKAIKKRETEELRIKFQEAQLSGKVKIPAMQDLTEPVTVTSPGAAVLHPYEMILPKGYSDFKTIPAPTIPAPATAGAAAEPQNRPSIQINVTATEKDLAQKVANEVRRVIAEYHLP